jgi:hypothetical protein
LTLRKIAHFQIENYVYAILSWLMGYLPDSSGNGPFPQSLRQSADLFDLRKIAHFQIENYVYAILSWLMGYLPDSSGNGPFPQSLRQSADLIVRRKELRLRSNPRFP